VIVIGHSFGSNLAYETVQSLPLLKQFCSLFISICGISFEYLSSQALYEENQFHSLFHGDLSSELYQIISENSLAMFDVVPEYLKDAQSKQFAHTLQDIKYTKQLLDRYSSRKVEEINSMIIPFTWIVGRKDKTTQCPHDNWKDLFPTCFERIVFEGNHFFLFENQRNLQKVMNECLQIINRKF
jgi:surfactin synthase thioesterase subunit